MTVYVESNFVLELALVQQQAAYAESILAQAERGAIQLAIPSPCLSEPLTTIAQRTRRRRRIEIELDELLADVRRARLHEDDVPRLLPISSVLADVTQREGHSVVRTVQRIANAAEIIALTRTIIAEAVAYARQGELAAPDAVILAAIAGHVRDDRAQPPHYFVTRDVRDFSAPAVIQELANYHCTIVFSFRECVDRLRSHERPHPAES